MNLGRQRKEDWGLDEKIDACKMLGSGLSPKDVAQRFDVSVQAIYDLKSKDDAQIIISQSAREYVSMLPAIMKRMKKDLRTSVQLSTYLADKDEVNPTNIKEEKNILKFQEVQAKRETTALQASTVAPSTGAPSVTNIYNDNRKQVLSDGVRAALGPGLASILGNEEPIEAEVIDD